jgi:hypothetical protein
MTALGYDAATQHNAFLLGGRAPCEAFRTHVALRADHRPLLLVPVHALVDFC